MTRERIAEPKHKRATPTPVSKTPIASGFREKKGATGGIFAMLPWPVRAIGAMLDFILRINHCALVQCTGSGQQYYPNLCTTLCC
jgi:hypothetical protein